ncbi:rRNA processing protein Krr1/Pno1 containing KH domain [Methanonatronarchaeum thermophilum]|uniref:rRNA processing protein Krr1/Pno1 containing KH domain n=1 Tax=Methanonatronarchaeum thermophilum TaxID=1927129 RepID=A0A1Y3GD44_9EURY|nr:KH domain-containing protein [Methanonatronarchaeum thermophilum]OUJ19160.1 rRNA processing protein Krr1/Pno1 containing KH domain [Methanonatronarchaeum thermophilum]
MPENIDYVKIPNDRIGVLIGKKGRTKEDIEARTGVKLTIDSNDGNVEINREDADPVLGWKTSKVVRAIGRGFTPEKAVKLLKDNYVLQILDITNYATTKKSRKRLKGRVIGKKGKTRNLLEDISGTNISIYGKTVSCIGKPERVTATIEAIEMILNGAPHGHAYRFLKENIPTSGEIEYVRTDHRPGTIPNESQNE